MIMITMIMMMMRRRRHRHRHHDDDHGGCRSNNNGNTSALNYISIVASFQTLDLTEKTLTSWYTFGSLMCSGFTMPTLKLTNVFTDITAWAKMASSFCQLGLAIKIDITGVSRPCNWTVFSLPRGKREIACNLRQKREKGPRC